MLQFSEKTSRKLNKVNRLEETVKDQKHILWVLKTHPKRNFEPHLKKLKLTYPLMILF